MVIKKAWIPSNIEYPLNGKKEHKFFLVIDLFPGHRHKDGKTDHNRGPGKTKYPSRRSPWGFLKSIVPIGYSSLTSNIPPRARAPKLRARNNISLGIM